MPESQEGEPMVSADVISRELNIPRATVYRLAKRGVMPSERTLLPHRDRWEYRFLLSVVRAWHEARTRRQAP